MIKATLAEVYEAHRMEKVWARGVHVGFVRATQVRPLAMAMDRVIDEKKAPVAMAAKLAIDGGKWPMVECDA